MLFYPQSETPLGKYLMIKKVLANASVLNLSTDSKAMEQVTRVKLPGVKSDVLLSLSEQIDCIVSKMGMRIAISRKCSGFSTTLCHERWCEVTCFVTYRALSTYQVNCCWKTCIAYSLYHSIDNCSFPLLYVGLKCALKPLKTIQNTGACLVFNHSDANLLC